MKDFRRTYFLPAPPEEVYLALTNPFTIRLWTNADAEMSDEPDSEFFILDGEISGKNLEFVTNKKIVQQWYFDENEADSIVTIKLTPHIKGTTIELIHTNIPDEAYKNIVEGWNDVYFGNLEAFFED